MAVEIERKFLVTGDGWRRLGEAVPYRQGYIATADGTTLRVRLAGADGYITIKRRVSDTTRSEWECPIPPEMAGELLDQVCARPLIEKRRTRVPAGDRVWEVDEFFGENEGLIVAEIELPDEDAPFDRPAWVGREVTQDPRYANVCLAKNPWRIWGRDAG